MANPDAGWGGRTTRIQKFDWDENDYPNFPRPLGFETLLDAPSGEE
jgi:hypothetical protein